MQPVYPTGKKTLEAIIMATAKLEDTMAVRKLQEAKTRFWDVSNDADADGLRGAAHKRDLRAYLLGGPKIESFDMPRDRDTGREVNLPCEP
jgi:hypothetical protein